MASTAAQRQAKYRRQAIERSQEEGGEARLVVWLSLSTKIALARLARHHGVSRREVLARLIQAADDAEIEKIEMNTPEWKRYFGEAAAQ